MQGYLDMLLSVSFAVGEVVPHLVSGSRTGEGRAQVAGQPYRDSQNCTARL